MCHLSSSIMEMQKIIVCTIPLGCRGSVGCSQSKYFVKTLVHVWPYNGTFFPVTLVLLLVLLSFFVPRK